MKGASDLFCVQRNKQLDYGIVVPFTQDPVTTSVSLLINYMRIETGTRLSVIVFYIYNSVIVGRTTSLLGKYIGFRTV